MRGLRVGLGFVALALTGAGLSAFGLAHCANPTQIVVEVYSDACSKINTTAISVGKVEGIDDKPPVAFRDGCQTATGIGTLTIYPSGANDEELAIKVVSGVDTTPTLCPAPGYAGCIAHRRVMRFIPNTTQHVRVTLSLACLNRTCPSGMTCDKGLCTRPEDLNDDGTTRPDAAVEEAGITPEGGVDAGPVDPCVGCKGTCAAGACTVDCATVNCATTDNLCAPTLPCTVKCPDTGKCKDIVCNTTAKCTVLCGEPEASCGKVSCTSGACAVACDGAGSCDGDGGIILNATGTARLDCKGDSACRFASCNAKTCELSCDPGGGSKAACPPLQNRPCSNTSDCTKWTTNPITP